jgi:hypothetical protein
MEFTRKMLKMNYIFAKNFWEGIVDLSTFSSKFHVS